MSTHLNAGIKVTRAHIRARGRGGEAELYRTSIFHRMRNIVPLHRSKPLAICVVQHLKYQRNSNKIDKNIVPWMSKILFFLFLLAKYSQRAIKA